MQLQLLATGCGSGGGSSGAAGSAAEQETLEALRGEVQGIYAQLGEVDPMRAGYYRDAVDGQAQVVMGAVGGVVVQ